MKANQAFKANDEAVSPVIGVILMVAITVVLAAVVFVLVSNLSKNSNSSAPSMTFNQDRSSHYLQVISADPTADWKNIQASVTSSAAAGTTACTATHSSSGTTAVGPTVTTAPVTGAFKATTLLVSAGDKITVSVASGQTGTCTLSLTYTTVNQLLGTWTFNF